MPWPDAEQTLSADRPSSVFRVRSAQFKDLTQITGVLLASFYPTAKPHRWWYWLIRWGIQEDIKTRLKEAESRGNSGYACLVVTTTHPETSRSGPIVGTVEISQRQCELWRLLPPKRAYLSNLAVRPDQRRQGAAQQLLSTCEAIALQWGFRQLYLHVMADNRGAQALYAQAGYEPCEVSNPILSGLGLRPQRLLLSKRL